MSDIPIGTPPSPPGRHAAPGGWYPDPIDASQERYWDGWQWSRTTRPREMPAQPQQFSPQPWAQIQPQPTQHQQISPGAPYRPAPYRPAPLGGTAQAAYTADGVPLSGWWWRVLAVWLDSVFVSLLVAIPAFPIYRQMYSALAGYFDQVLRAAQAGAAAPPQPDVTSFLSSSDQLFLVAIQIGLALIYNIGFLRWKSATPGKLICGLRVVPVDQGNSTGKLPWGSVLIRVVVWVAPLISTFLLVFRLIDGLFPLWQPKRQALHDLAAKTQVIRRAG